MGFATEHNHHSMKSTWTTADPSTWNGYQRFIHNADIYPIIPGKPPPLMAKTDAVPVLSDLSMHVWISAYLLVPMALHQTWVSLTGWNLHAIAVFALYTAAFVLIASRQTHSVRRLIYEYGVLDGEHERDPIPDEGAGKILKGMHKVAALRIGAAAFAVYNSSQAPLDALTDLSWWVGLAGKLSLYGIFIDLYFYAYHRACHEVPWLWKYHRTHHLTKHPTVMMTGWADEEQELIEMILVPVAAFLSLWAIGLKLGFYDWWICFQYVTFAEVMGHSGLRLHLVPPSPISWLLRILDMELVIEDHDLHHRRGWKKSYNYGKQTRVFDRLFGSGAAREEMAAPNVDHSKVVNMPLF